MGSFPLKAYLPDSDLDMTICTNMVEEAAAAAKVRGVPWWCGRPVLWS
jgi:hypothetical protein